MDPGRFKLQLKRGLDRECRCVRRGDGKDSRVDGEKVEDVTDGAAGGVVAGEQEEFYLIGGCFLEK